MTDRQLYFISGSPPCWSVMLALEVKGLAYTPKRLDNAKREQKAPEFLALNPRGQVPVLIEGDLTVCETFAILTFLDAAHETPGQPALFGETPVETARTWQRISEVESNLRDQVGDISRPLFRGKGAEFAEQIARNAEKVRAELALLEARLEGQPFLAGDAMSAADLIAYPVIMQLDRAGQREEAKAFDLAYPLKDHFPNLAAWGSRIETLPGYDKAYPPHWKMAMPEYCRG